MKHKTQKQPKANVVRTRHYDCAYVKVWQFNNLPCYPPDSHQSHDAVYWKTGGNM